MASRALIIANSRYDDEHFAPLPGAAADAAELARVLGDAAIGGFSVETLADVEQRTAMRALESFFAQAKPDDLLLLHLSPHGWKDIRNRLHFVMRDTERDYPGSTAVSAEPVAGWMGESRSRRIIVILDCCYSGAFALGALRREAGTPTVDIAEPFAGNGRVVLTASTALQYAHENERDIRYSRAPAQPSVFTSAVVNGLRDGSADLDGDGLVSVDELYDYVHEQVRRRIAGQTPTLSVDSAQGTIYVARSPRHGDVDRLAEMRAAVLDAQAWKRIGALHLVAQLLGSVREPTRDAARAALLGLIADGDREVARQARELWHKRGLGEIPTARVPRPPRPAGRRPDATGPPYVGIDFGTTNSAIGVFEGEDVRLIPNPEGALSTPSLVGPVFFLRESVAYRDRCRMKLVGLGNDGGPSAVACGLWGVGVAPCEACGFRGVGRGHDDVVGPAASIRCACSEANRPEDGKTGDVVRRHGHAFRADGHW